ncbi:MAG: flavin monoamine oxidase family protein [Alphaproteobacteria bacterium]
MLKRKVGRPAITSLGRSVQRMIWPAALAEKTGMPADEAVDHYAELEQKARQKFIENKSRRDFLKITGMATPAFALSAKAGLAFSALNGDPDVAIVGGGLAGLRAAHSLLDLESTWDVRVYEGSDRIGGRCYTNRGFFADNMHAELGAQTISSEQRAIQQLCHSLGIGLEDVWIDDSEEATYLLNGVHVSAAAMQDQWVKDGYYQIFKNARRNAPWAPLYYNIRKKHLKFDNMTVNEWLDDVGIGADTDFGQLMQSTHLAEYGLNGDEGSALNLIYILAWNGRTLAPVEGLDSSFQIEGGNDNLVYAMADVIGEPRIELGRKLEAIQGNAEGPYTLSFDTGPDVTAPKVILTIPHTTLRDVDIDPSIWSAFGPEKQDMVENFGMAESNKLHVQFDNKYYLDDFIANGLDINPNGDIYTSPGDDSVNCAWDETIGQRETNPTDKGIMICFPGRERARAMHSEGLNEAAVNADITEFVAQLDAGIPGAIDNLTGGNSPKKRRALASNWIENKWSKGAYGAFYTGQWTAFNGAGEEVVGQNLHFAGEWTDVEWQGYMEGAIISGERAAREVWQSS